MDKIFRLLIFTTVGIYLASCSKTVQIKEQSLQKPNPQEMINDTKTDTAVKPTQPFRRDDPPPLILKPVLKEISPLEDKYFTFAADNVPIKTVLFAIAKDSGLNLIISPDVDVSKKITANFNKTPMETALKIVTDLAGVYYQLKDNVIFIKATETKVFHLPYVHTNSSYKSELGGDVLGSSGRSYGGSLYGAGTYGGTGGYGGTGYGGGSISNLRGDFSLTFESPEDINNFYDTIEENLKIILYEASTPNITSIQKNRYVLNRFTGTLIVTATKEKMKKVEKLIKRIQKEIKKQVLIEAKIIEITLDKEFRYGIDWNLLMKNFLGTGASVKLSQTLALGSSFGQVVVTGGDFQSLINALEKTGKLETLSNPRIRVLNGQTALISSGVIVPFWEKQVSTVTGTAATQQTFYIKTNVLNGILLGVTPYIEDKEILMNIVPVSTKIEDIKQLREGDQVLAEAPILNVKEAGTIIKVQDGDLIIIGGLIGTEKRKVISKVPGLGDIPGIGALFRNEEEISQKKELIIFLKPHIIKVD